MPETTLSNAEAVLIITGFALLLFVLWGVLLYGSRLAYTGARAGYGRLSQSTLAERFALRAWFRERFPRTYGVIAARLDPRSFTGLPLTLFVVAGFYLLVLLGGLVEAVLEAEEAQTFDQAIADFIAPYRHWFLIALFLWLTELASMPTLSAVAIVASGFLWARGPRAYIPAVWLSVLGSQITTYSGKYVFARERPEFVLDVTAYTPAFPSGHATGAMAVYGIIAYAILRELPWPRGRFEIAFWTTILIVLIGFSRIFLGVHFTTDVAAGFLVGGFWLMAGIALAEMSRRKIPSIASGHRD